MRFYKKKSEDKLIAVCDNDIYEIQDTLSETAIINKKPVKVEFSEDKEGFLFVEYKNKKYQVEIAEKKHNRYSVLVNGVSHYISIESSISMKRKELLKKQQGESKVLVVRAPMPGKIVDILVEEGEKVNQGDSLLILEAMKMQNEILADITGTIRKIHVLKGANVMKDDLMIEIDK